MRYSWDSHGIYSTGACNGLMGCLWNMNGIDFWDIYIYLWDRYSWARMGYSRF
jgi:hypothetical protein